MTPPELGFPISEYRQRLSRAQRMMAQAGLEAMLLTTGLVLDDKSCSVKNVSLSVCVERVLLFYFFVVVIVVFFFFLARRLTLQHKAIRENLCVLRGWRATLR